MKYNKLLFLILLLLATAGCSNDDKYQYYMLFIGKWQQIDCGTYWPDSISKLYVKPNGHILEFFENRTTSTKYTNCRTDAEFLYYTLMESQDYIYRYTFTGPDTLRLDYEYGLMTMSMGTVISNTYKRLK
jgi:hypothetical protein